MSHSSDERGAELRDLFFETAQELLQSLNEDALKLERRWMSTPWNVLVFPVGEFQRVQCVLERCDQNLHVFGREGMIVFEKEANRHGGLHSATYTTALATGSPANGHKCEDLVKKASFGALTLLQGRA